MRTKVNGEHSKKTPEEEKQKIIDDFHKLFHEEGAYDCRWLGTRTLKYATDLITY